MQRTSLRRQTVLLLLAAMLAFPWVAMAGPSTQSAPPDQTALAAPMGFLGRLWGFLEHLWNATGCHIDPNGLCRTGLQGDEGCHIDPDGLCVTPAAGTTTIQGDTGCHIDPDGRCVP